MSIKSITLVKCSLTSAMLFSAFPLYAATEQPSLTVTAAPGQPPSSVDKKATLGNLGAQEIRNTPWSVQTVSPQLMKRQQLKSVSALYRYMPSVQGDGARPQTRGMQGSVVQNSMIDGLNVVSTTDYAAEQFDRIEVLNGLAGSLYGPANPAGLFNFISKRASDIPQHSLTFGAGTGLSHQLAGDFSGPLDSNDRLRYRLNMLDDEGNSYVSGSTRRRQLFSLALDANLTDRTVLETNFSYYHYYDKGLPGKFALANGLSLPSAPNPETAHPGQSYAGNDNHTLTAGVHLRHDFDGNWQGEVGVLRQIADRESTAVTHTFTDNKGSYTTTTSSATASRFTINSYMANLNGEVASGGIHHQIATGLRGFVWKITIRATAVLSHWAAPRWIIPRPLLNLIIRILPGVIIQPPRRSMHFCSAIICNSRQSGACYWQAVKTCLALPATIKPAARAATLLTAALAVQPV